MDINIEFRFFYFCCFAFYSIVLFLNIVNMSRAKVIKFFNSSVQQVIQYFIDVFDIELDGLNMSITSGQFEPNEKA